MAFERIHPENVHPVVWSDHYHRYLFARDYCSGLVIDAACGVGYGSEILRKNLRVRKYIGLDISEQALTDFRAHYQGEYADACLSDVLIMPVKTGCADTVISFETLEHLQQPELLIREAARVLKPGGIFIGSVPSRAQEEIIDELYGENPFHLTRFDWQSIESLIHSCFPFTVLFHQSLEVIDFIREKDPDEAKFYLDENPRNLNFAFGPILFVASMEPIPPGLIKNQNRFLLCNPFYEIDRSHINLVRQLNDSLLSRENQLTKAGSDLDASNAEVDRLNGEVESLRGEVLFLRGETDRLNGEVDSLRGEVLFLRGETDRLNGEVDSLRGETDRLNGEVDSLRSERDRLNGEVDSLRNERERLNAEGDSLRGEINRLNTEGDRLQQDQRAKQLLISSLTEELDSIRSSLSFRLMLRLKQLPGIKLAKGPLLQIAHVYKRLRVGRRASGVHIPSTANETGAATPLAAQIPEPNETVKPVLDLEIAGGASTQAFNLQDQAWLERMAQSPRPVSVLHPNWLGIRSSTQQLFQELYLLDDILTNESAMYYARLFSDAQVPAIVIQGFPSTYQYLIQAIKKVNPDLPIYVIWHGSFMQSNEDYNWSSFRLVESLCRNGLVNKWGFVKKGMAEVMAKSGLNTGFVMNYVRAIPDGASQPKAGGPHFGLWASSNTWRKLPYAMIAALADIPNAEMFAAGHASERILDFANMLQVKLNYEPQPIPQASMPLVLAQMHLNMYVTLSECTPMVPLESLSVGVPCIIGPTSHLFEEDEYLHSRLVVPYPDRSDVISNFVHNALDERDQIIAAYQNFAPKYNKKAQAILRDFLDGLEA